MPSAQEVIEFEKAFRQLYHLLTDVFCVAEGLKLHLEQSSNSVNLNMFYNGWTHGHYVGNVFVFVPSGVIIACEIDAPSSMHNAIIAEWRGIYKKLGKYHGNFKGFCVVDSAFSRGDFRFLIKYTQDALLYSDGDSTQLALLQQAISAR